MNTYYIKRFHPILVSGLFGVLSLIFNGCEDFVELSPPRDQLIRQTVFSSDEAAYAAIRGLYADFGFSGPFSGNLVGINVLAGMCADELYYRMTFADYNHFAENSLDATNVAVAPTWNHIYKLIYQANSILEGLQSSSEVSPSVAQQIAGEAKFVRAFCNFYLVNLWGNVPLVLTTDYRQNMRLHREESEVVYDQIITDLQEAEMLLVDDYSVSGGERVRPNSWAAKALLARVFLFLGSWKKAEEKSTEVINSGLFDLCANVNDVFLKNSTEAIWQLYPMALVFDTEEGRLFLPGSSASSVTSYPLISNVINDFELEDARLANWVNSKVVSGVTYYYPTKYKVRSIVSGSPHFEYSVVLRAAEQYLIRAEARARQGNVVGSNSAESDINVVRNRAGIANTSASGEEEMLLAIEHERRCELFSEWGHRWFDLIRTARATPVLGEIKTGWQEEDMLWPIPQTELSLNPNLSQNEGY